MRSQPLRPVYQNLLILAHRATMDLRRHGKQPRSEPSSSKCDSRPLDLCALILLVACVRVRVSSCVMVIMAEFVMPWFERCTNSVY